MSNYSPPQTLRVKLTNLGHRFDIAWWSNASRAMVGRLSVLQVGSHPVLAPGAPFQSRALYLANCFHGSSSLLRCSA